MPFNILDSVMNMITPNHIDSASTHLGESSANIKKAVSVGVPSILAGLISKVEKGEGSSLLNEVTQAGNNSGYTNPAPLFSGSASGTGTNLLGSLFGLNHSTITDAISRYSGISSSSSGSLLAMLAPLVLGLLGKHASSNNLTAGGLTSLLSEHKEKIAAAMPTGFNPPGLLSLNSARNMASDSISKVSGRVEGAKPTNRVLPILIGLVAIALLIYFLSRGCKSNDNTNTAATTTDTTTTSASVTPAPAPVVARESMKVKLANGTELDAYKGGIEDKLVACLNDESCKPGKDKWFDFDNINFETGSANLTPESKSQLSNLVMILKAYPKVKIKIGGYTDKTGDSTVNNKLSNNRAQTVASALKADGSIASRIIGAEGYGSQFAKLPATASDEERKSDRRISVQLAEK